MKFGAMPRDKAEGAILAHSLRLKDGKNEKRLAKGRVLKPADIRALAAAGVEEVVVARLEETDLAEDAAAQSVADALIGDQPSVNLTVDAPITGRVNLRAATAGVITVDADKVGAANRINPHITIATVAQYARLPPRGLAATIKIITYGVPKVDVEAVQLAASSAIRLHPPFIETATLIETYVPNAPTADKGRRATQTRLARFGVELAPRVLVPHDEAAIADALGAATTDLVLILTGSATSDPADTAPSALVKAGGKLAHYGMPVDPGNLLFLGALGETPVIGLPGCARSPALNGADWVLERVICGLPVNGDDIAAMGVGGLLKEIPSRPRPREK